jgi:hypothetical protein
MDGDDHFHKQLFVDLSGHVDIATSILTNLSLIANTEPPARLVDLSANNSTVLPLHLRKKIPTLVKSNMLSAAIQKLEQYANEERLLEMNHATRLSLRNLHPTAHPQRDILRVCPVNFQPICLTTGAITDTIRRAKKHKSAGLGSWCYETIRSVYLHNSQLRDNITALFNLVLRGQGGPAEFWCSSKLLPFSKENNGIRPIAISSAWFRLLCSTVATSLSQDLQDLLPFQFGVAARNGIEHIIHIVSGLADDILSGPQTSSKAILQVDVKNAFNSIGRECIQKNLMATSYLHGLVPFFTWAYGKSTPLYANDGSFLFNSETGIRQGDPLGPLFFAIGIQDILKRVKSSYDTVDVLAYLDDIHLTGPNSQVKKAFKALESALLQRGLVVNKNKSKLFQRSPSPDWQGIPIVNDGLRVLGSPVGTPTFIQSSMTGLTKKTIKILPTLLQFDPKIKFLLLQSCINARPNFLARTSKPWLNQDALSEFDSMVSKCLFYICEHGSADQLINTLTVDSITDLPMLPPTSDSIRSLPVIMGGLGLRKAHEITRPAYVSSWLNSMAWTASNLPHLWNPVARTYSTQNFTVLLSDPAVTPYLGDIPDIEALSLALIDTPLPSQKTLTQAMVDKPKKISIQESLGPSPAHAAYFRSQTMEDGMLWINNLTSRIPDLMLHDKAFLTNLRLSLLLPTLSTNQGGDEGIRCSCGKHLVGADIQYHALSCGTAGQDGLTGPGGIRFRRHDSIRDALAVFLQKACPQGIVTKEHWLPRTEDDVAIRMDVQLSNANHVHYFDVVVKNPASVTSILAHSDSEDLIAAKCGERDKRYKFERIYRRQGPFGHLNNRLLPFALEATGALGTIASKVIHKLRSFVVSIPEDTPSVSSARKMLRRRIASIVANDRAALVHWFQNHISEDYLGERLEDDLNYSILSDDI